MRTPRRADTWTGRDGGATETPASYTPDYRDILIEEFADIEAAMHAELIEARADRDTYKLIAVEALQYAQRLQRELAMVDSRERIYRRHVQPREEAA